MKPLFKSITISDLIRLVIGAVFIFAALPKIGDPLDFAFNLSAYQLFPKFSISLLAIFVPYLELFTGLFLITGVFKKGALVISGGMFAVFIFALLYAIILGIDINCGCFGQNPAEKSNLWYRLFEDLLYLAGIIYIAYKEKISD